MKSTISILVSLLLCSATLGLAINPFHFISKMIHKPSTFTPQELGEITQSIISELSADSKTCTYTSALNEEHTYNFNPLAGKIAELDSPDGTKVFKANFCSDLDKCTAKFKDEDIKGSFCIFEKASGSVKVVLGSFIHDPLPTYKLRNASNPDGGFEVFFRNGVCNPYRCGFTLYLECDPTNSGKPVITDAYQGETMHRMTISTRRACLDAGGDGEDGISGGTIFLIILFSLLTLYFVIGAVVNKFLFRKNGLEIIPNRNFWAALPSFVIAGFRFAFGGFKRRGFQQMGDN